MGRYRFELAVGILMMAWAIGVTLYGEIGMALPSFVLSGIWFYWAWKSYKS